MDNNTKAFALIQLGFDDYIASRHLLNNKLIMQGVTLASTAVEKYLKAVLATFGKVKKVHLDRLDVLKNQLKECYTDFTDKFDERFLEILGKAYKIRYYHDNEETITIGFFLHQFLCELDYTIHFFENVVYTGIKDGNDNEVLTFYKKYVHERNPNLTFNNYLFEGLSKNEFMERPGYGYCIYFNPKRWDGNILVEGHNVKNSYDGRITLINMNFK